MTKTTASICTPDAAGKSRAPSLQTHNLSFRWHSQQPPLKFPDINLNAGDHLFVRGASGSGKSTLLGLLAGLNAADSGKIRVLGQPTLTFTTSARDRFRADHIGVIFQQFNLVPYLTALANTILPCQLSAVRRKRVSPATAHRTTQGTTHANINAKAASLLTALSIPQQLHSRKPAQLSIGQQQRVAAARALMGAPELILADEPTSALDTQNRDRFMALLLELAQRNTTSVVFVSHDPTLARHFHHQIELEQLL